MVSVVMTAYNVGEYIEQAIVSVLEQSYDKLELIVVLDAPTDNTAEIVGKFTDKRIRVINNPENLGAGASRKAGIEAARGEYVICVDGDDYLRDDFIESLVKRAVETDADVVVGGVSVMRDNGAYEKVCYGAYEKDGEEKYAAYRQERVPFINNKLIRRALFKKVPYCERRFIEDLPTYNKLLYFAQKVAYVNNDGYFYRQHNKSLLHEADRFKHLLFNALFYMDVIKFYEEHNKELGQKLGYAQGYIQLVKELKALKPTAEQIDKYRTEWTEFSLDLLQSI